MVAFSEQQIDDEISTRAISRPTWKTEIVELDGGTEERNRVWSLPHYEFEVRFGGRDDTVIAAVVDFFHARAGRHQGFRFKDWTDYRSSAGDTAIADTDQTLGTGDAAETDFQLVKAYTSGSETLSRTIKKPVSGTVVVSLDDVSQGSGWSVDTTTGIITFTSPPGAGVVVKAGFEFDVPVRFRDDVLEFSMHKPVWGDIEAVTFIEDLTA